MGFLLNHRAPKAADMRGLRFGRLVVEECSGRSRHEHTLWRCRCDCGRVAIASRVSLLHRSSPTLSCGCLRSELSSARMRAMNARRSAT